MSFYTSPDNIAWRVSNVIQIPNGLFFVVLSFWYPESPRWLLEKYPEDPDWCLQTLAKIRLEFHELVSSRESRQHYDSGYVGLLKSKSMRKRLCLASMPWASSRSAGIAALTIFAALIYESLGGMLGIRPWP
jgi:hypothetical protein